MRLGYQTITWGGVVGDPVGVTSVKDLFYRVNGPVADAIRQIGDLGYQGVEIFDGNAVDFARDVDAFRALLEEAGVALEGVYTGGNFVYEALVDDELHKIRRACEAAQALGAENLVVGGGAQRAHPKSPADYLALGRALDAVTAIAEDHGLVACFHPHLSTIVESPDEVDRILDLTRMAFCPDIAHLAGGGGDPADIIRRHGARMRHVHLKDLRRDPFAFMPLGEGDIDLRAVLAAVLEHGYDSWLVIELDAYDGDPVEAARSSKSVLDRLLREFGL